MKAVFPIGSIALFPLIVCLATTSRHQLHGIGDEVAAFPVIDEQMDMIRGDHIIQHTQVKTLPGFKEPAHPGLAVSGKFQQKLSLMAAMSQVPNLPSQVMAMRPSHERTVIRMTSFSGSKSDL